MKRTITMYLLSRQKQLSFALLIWCGMDESMKLLNNCRGDEYKFEL